MNNFQSKVPWLFWLLFCFSCQEPPDKVAAPTIDSSLSKGTYGYDADFLKKHTRKTIELQGEAGAAKILLSADYEGRVMTSTAQGDSGNSYGWLNYQLIASGDKKPQFNAFGGEERLWMGPEGGQFSLYFKKGDSFNIAHWQVPAVIDTVMYDITQADNNSVTFCKTATLTNYAASVFTIGITRKVQLLNKEAVEKMLHLSLPPELHVVAYQSYNAIRNEGNQPWKKEKGLLSIWLLGMMSPTEETKVIIPFNAVKDSRSYITDDYFGKIPPDRLLIKDSVLFLRCDGKSRGKVGVSPIIARPLVASFDFKKNALTILIPEVEKNGMYVNSKWELQKLPYKGDVINSYNDGPMADGKQLGPFYEIESSSAVKELKPGETEEYRQTTCHFQGDYQALAELAERLTGVDLDQLKQW